jgi:simple sugar transport system substrate-binding protein
LNILCGGAWIVKKFPGMSLPFFVLFVALAWYFTQSGDREEGHENAYESRIVLGFAQLGAESEWRVSSSLSVKEAARKYGIELMFVNAQQKQENQIKAIRSFIAHRVDVIAFSPVVEAGWDNVLQEAKAEGIPVVLVDRSIYTDQEGLYVTFLGSDFVEEGKRAGRWLLGEYSNFPGRVKIVELRGTEGSSPTRGRDEGFREVISQNGSFEIVRLLRGDFMRSRGREEMERLLSDGRFPSSGDVVDVLFAHNDDMAMGAIEAMEERGIRPGRDVVIISVDAQRSALEALGQGRINCVVECNPYIGEQLMELVRKLAAGGEVPERIYSDETVYTADDIGNLPSRPW